MKNHFSRYLVLVREAEVVRVYNRDMLVALIVPIQEAAAGSTAASVRSRRRSVWKGVHAA